jgi:hypothetical protein
MKKIITSLSSALLILAASLSLTGVAKSAEFFTIGTGGPTGVYFQTGNAICKMLHKSAISAEHGRKKVQRKPTDVLHHQLVDQIIILVKLLPVNFNLVLRNQIGNIML